MMNEKLRAENVAAKVGISTMTLNRWYRFKNENQGTLFDELPEFTRDKNNSRLWDEQAIPVLIAFKNKLPKGRKGVMGKYAGKGTGRENG